MYNVDFIVNNDRLNHFIWLTYNFIVTLPPYHDLEVGDYSMWKLIFYFLTLNFIYIHVFDLFAVFAGRNNSTSDDNPAITLERRKRGVIRDKLLNFVSRRPSKESLEQKGIIRGYYLGALCLWIGYIQCI